MMKLLKKEKGITLITLVLAVILVIILAIYLFSLTSNNEKKNKAKDNNDYVFTSATIISTETEYLYDDSYKLCTYEYFVDDVSYTGTFKSYSDFDDDEINSEIEIKYKKDNPNKSKVVEVKPSFSKIIPVIIGVILLLLFAKFLSNKIDIAF